MIENNNSCQKLNLVGNWIEVHFNIHFKFVSSILTVCKVTPILYFDTNVWPCPGASHANLSLCFSLASKLFMSNKSMTGNNDGKIAK